MEQSKGILKRVSCFAISIIMMVALAGCDIADRLRPDLYFGSEVRILPNEEDIPNQDVMPGAEVAVWPNGSPYSPEYNYTPKNPTIVAENFEPFKADTIADEDYIVYLEEQVYDKLKDIIDTLDPDVSKQIYLRVGHAGYNYTKNDPTIRKGTGCDLISAGRSFSSNRTVGGDTLITFAVDWLSHLEENAEHKDVQVRAAQGQIDFYATPEDMSKSWYELNSSSLPVSYYRMFGRDGADFKSLQEYYDAIATDPYHNIPNYSLFLKSSETSVANMTFNKVATNINTPYESGVTMETVNKLFRQYNQYPTRSRDVADETKQDDSSMLRYYLDGYNKTLIFIATAEGTNLKDLVGESNYRKMFEIINGAYNCTQCSEITAIKPADPDPNPSESPAPSATPTEPTGPDYSGFKIISAGSKGVE